MTQNTGTQQMTQNTGTQQMKQLRKACEQTIMIYQQKNNEEQNKTEQI